MVYGIYGIGFITSNLDHDQRASRPMTPSVPPPRLSTMSHESLWNAVISWPAVGAISASSSQFEDDTNVRLKKSGVAAAEHVGITLGEWMAAISPAEKTRPIFYPFRFSSLLSSLNPYPGSNPTMLSPRLTMNQSQPNFHSLSLRQGGNQSRIPS